MQVQCQASVHYENQNISAWVARTQPIVRKTEEPLASLADDISNVFVEGGPPSVSPPRVITTSTYSDGNWHHAVAIKSGVNCLEL